MRFFFSSNQNYMQRRNYILKINKKNRAGILLTYWFFYSHTLYWNIYIKISGYWLYSQQNYHFVIKNYGTINKWYESKYTQRKKKTVLNFESFVWNSKPKSMSQNFCLKSAIWNQKFHFTFIGYHFFFGMIIYQYI